VLMTDNARRADSVDICNDESVVSSTADASVDEVVAMAPDTSQQRGEADSVEPSADCEDCSVLDQPLKPDESVIDGTELKDAADGGQEVDVGTERRDVAEACDSVASDADVGVDTEHKPTDTSREDDLQSDTAAVDDSEARSTEIQPRVTDNSTDSTLGARKIDWDALERPKQKSSFQENAEFSQVFHKVVKRKSNAESTDSPTVNVESPSSCATDLSLSSSEPCAKFDDTQLPSETSKVISKTDGEAETLPLTSSTDESEQIEVDNNHIDTDISQVTVDHQTVSVEPVAAAVSSNCLAPSSSSCSQPLASAKDSTVVSKTNSQDDDVEPSPSREYSTVADKTNSHDAGIQPSSPFTESQTVEVKPSIEDTSHDKESFKIVKTESSDEDSNPSCDCGVKYSDISETKSSTESTSQSCPSEEPSAMTEIAPCGEDKDPFSSGAHPSSDSDRTEPCTEGTRPPSLGAECSAVTETKPRDEDVPAKQQREDFSTEFETRSLSDPQNDVQSFKVAEVKQKESFCTNEAKLGDAGLNIHLSKPDTSTTSGEFDQPVTSLTFSDPADHKQVIPTESTGPCDSGTTVDIGASGRLPGDEKPTSTDISASANALEINREEENTNEPEASSVNSSKTVAPQQKKVFQKSSAKVQPSEPKTTEPAWLMAAKRKSNQWSEGRVEEFDRKLQKPEVDADNEVSP